jgi:peptide subunit release factor 1 (eRF1)
MQTNQLSDDTLRRLAETRPREGRVVSVYINLDPSQFGNEKARNSAINSVMDQAERKARDEDPAVRHDVERLRGLLRTFDFQGAHGLALFACGPEQLLESFKLPRSVPSTVVIDDAPYVEPLVEVQPWARYAVALVNRKVARIFRGSRDRLDEVAVLVDDVPRRHDQGGWSQARFQRSIDKEAQDHMRRAADELLRRYERRPFDALFVAAPEADFAEFCGLLHPYLRERLAGRIEVDVENTAPEEVRQAADGVIGAYERSLEKDMLDRLVAATSSGGRGATGLEDTLEALNEQRVEALLLQDNFDAAGVCCPQCGWLGPPGVTQCPADGTDTVEREDITDLAVRRAITQSARVVVVGDDDRLEPLGSIAALLRF